MAYYYNDYSRMNAAKARKKFIRDALENYTPPTTYKNKVPTKEEFGIEKIDIDELKKLKEAHEKKNNNFSMFSSIWFMFGAIIGALISKYLFDNSHIVWFSVWLIPFVLGIILGSRKFKYENLLNKFRDYDMAVFQYEWWQKKKRKNFWFAMSGRKFEIQVADLFRKMGYEAHVCKQGGDEGIDIEIFKNGKYEIIQCKAHKNKVSPSVSRDLYGTMNANNVKKAYLITLNGATSGTIDFCRKHNIEIWDIDDILRHQDEL